jgi:hypothetical protein
MSYSINLSDDGKYIILKVVGTINRQLAVKYNLEAHALGKEKNIDRFFLDFSECHNTDTVFRNYKYVYDDMQNPGINQQARTVMVVDPKDHSHDYIEAFFRNAGADFSLYTDPKLAVWHLMDRK